jgi:1,4-alpha-glucan branching enzyme
MPADHTRVGPNTPMGANLVPGGCTFRAWAPRADAVYVAGSFNGWKHDDDASRLVRDANGYWSGFLPGVTAGAEYKFFMRGPGPRGPEGFKRDPYAREIIAPDGNCVISDPAAYTWHDQGFRPPAFEDLIIYQFHIGTFYAADQAGNDRRAGRVAKFLDVLDRVEYLAELGVTAVQPLPIAEFPTAFSLGYNGVDYFSPEFDYAVAQGELTPYLARANALLAARGHSLVSAAEIRGAANQLRLLVDVLHVYGMAVIFDVVYNHAGGDFGDESLYFFDRVPSRDQNQSLYFTDQGWAGGLVFAYWNASVRQFLIDNAVFLAAEFHADGLRYDEVSVIDRYGGWRFCQDLTDTMRYAKSAAVQIAEFWNPGQDSAIRPTTSGGAGFDLVWHAGMREAVRGAIAQAAGGRDAFVNLDPVRDALAAPPGFDGAWRAVQMLENHDVLLTSHSPQDRRPRIPAVADPSNARSWYARSRARVATGLLLTGPGVPMLFMGQEFLEDKLWNDSPDDPDHRIWWEGLLHDRAMSDHLRFTRDLIALRRRLAALRRGQINIFHCHNPTRVLAFHRWIERQGHDVMVAVSLSESTYYGYAMGFPRGGRWLEVFNSDVYDGWVNPAVAGNGGGVFADGPAIHGLPSSASVVLPANGLVVFAHEG